MARTNVSKFPAAFCRSSSFCLHINSAARSSLALVVKWPCQKKVSFSCKRIFPERHAIQPPANRRLDSLPIGLHEHLLQLLFLSGDLPRKLPVNIPGNSPATRRWNDRSGESFSSSSSSRGIREIQHPIDRVLRPELFDPLNFVGGAAKPRPVQQMGGLHIVEWIRIGRDVWPKQWMNASHVGSYAAESTGITTWKRRYCQLLSNIGQVATIPNVPHPLPEEMARPKVQRYLKSSPISQTPNNTLIYAAVQFAPPIFFAPWLTAPKTVGSVVIDDACRLHPGIDDHRPDKLESPFLQGFGNLFRQRRLRRDLARVFRIGLPPASVQTKVEKSSPAACIAR